MCCRMGPVVYRTKGGGPVGVVGWDQLSTGPREVVQCVL